ncbi:MAG: hypothetical protein ACREJB_13990, partial [Planctomycetaceae bacterium]
MMNASRGTACQGLLHSPITRRQALCVGGAGLLGLTLPKLLRSAEAANHPPPRAKSVVFLYQFG